MKQIISSLLIMIVATSCYHVYYAPNTANTPLLSQKGEVRVNGLYAGGGNSEFEGGELQAAAAVSKNVGVMISGMLIGKTENVSNWDGTNSHEESGKGSYVEVAGGLFKNFDEKKKWIGEIYGGTGFGTANNTYEGGRTSRVGVFKFFLQPAVGYKTPYFELAFVPKVSFVNWKVKEDGLSTINPGSSQSSNEDDLNKIRQKPGLVNFEPALIVRAGGENVKIQGALSFSNFNNDYYPVETLNASIGISINLKPKKN